MNETSTSTLTHLRKPPDPLTGFHDAYDVTWVAACGWNARAEEIVNDRGPKQVYRDLTTNNILAVTCNACLDAVILQGDLARDRFLKLEREAGEVKSEVSHG